MKLLITITLILSSFTTVAQKFHTEFHYTDSIHKRISIKNSYPKGGLTYTDPYGNEYVYVVFWTSITNETSSALQLTIDAPESSFIIPSSPDIKFRLYLPKEKMTVANSPLFNYGLDIKSFLDKNIDRPSKTLTTISPGDSYLFYSIALSDNRVNGIIRAGFELDKNDLLYKINDLKISCGKIDFHPK